MIKVFKFGGALMKDAEGIRKVSSLIKPLTDKQLIVVVSALGKTTSELEEILQLALDNKKQELNDALNKLKQKHIIIINQLFSESFICSKKFLELFEKFKQRLNEINTNRYFSYDQIVSYGEKFSSLILNEFFKQEKLPCRPVDARLIISTDDNYTSAKVNWGKTSENIMAYVIPVLNTGEFVLTEGFIGSDSTGNTTTLGREGSDYTASILANILDTNEVSIWKDVPGLMNADPNRFNDSIKLDQISYHEAIELAFYGASVIHPKTIQPLQQQNIPLFVRSFSDPDTNPSIISKDTSMDDKVHKIIVKDKQVLLSINSRDLSFIAEEHLTNIFKTFSRHKIHINLMQHSAVSFSVCFNSDKNKLKAVLNDLKDEFLIKYNDGLQLITVRHYSEKIIIDLVKNREVLLEQKSRSTVQILIK